MIIGQIKKNMQFINTRNFINLGILISISFFAIYLNSVEAQENTTESNTAATPTPIDRQNIIDERQQNLENRADTISDRIENNKDERLDNISERQEIRAENIEGRQELRTERAEVRQELQAERRGALEAIRQERVLNLSANISNRMDAAIERLNNIINRFEERINKISNAGIDVTAASEKLGEAKRYLAEARNKIADIDNLVYNATTAADPRTEWTRVKATYQEVGDLIRRSHTALRETLTLLKAALSEANQSRSEAVRNDVDVNSASE